MIAPQSECPCFGEQRASPPQIYLTTKRATQSKGKSRGTWQQRTNQAWILFPPRTAITSAQARWCRCI